MSINFNDEKKIFTIQTKKTTYQMMVDDYGYLLHLYYGRKTHGIMDYLLTYNDRGFSGNPYEAERDRTYSLDTLPQEYPAAGGADYRNLAINAVNSDGSYGLDMRYVDYEIRDGKYSLQGLPAVYADEKEAQTLTIILEDEVKQIRVELYYGVLPEIDIITRAAKVTNLGAETIHINKLLSSCLDLVHGSFEVITFYGKHCMERETQRKTVGHGTITVGSKRGMSSHQYNPCVILTHPKTTEGSGACFGFELVYSGGFIAEIEKDQFNQTRVLMGMSHEQLSYPLEHSQSLIAPEVMMTFSGDGLAGLSHNFHDCIRDHIIRGKYQKTPRPVLLNSWEALYMDFNGEDIYQLAKSCADLDIDLLVMDDGWFGHRDTDTTSLGDWVVNEEKLGEPLGHLIERINALGMKFGIWFEPECVSEDSDLYRAHPDWALAVPGRNPIRSRYQLVLDFSRKEVVDAVFDSVCKVLDQGNIEYVKWDMNRSLSDVYSAATKNQGRVFYDYVLGLYDFLERIHVRYPHILIEGCSGGGGRFDAGMLYYTPQIWCSDNTDAVDRLKIQYGTSFGYPVCTMGSHVSDVPNHQTGRVTPLETRKTVAMAGTFGYELNPAKLSDEEKNSIRQQVAEYRALQNLIFTGDYYRLSDPYKQKYSAWSFVSKDKKECLMQLVVRGVQGNPGVVYVRFAGLDPDATYQDVETGKMYPGQALNYMGMPMPFDMITGEYPAHSVHMIAVEQ